METPESLLTAAHAVLTQARVDAKAITDRAAREAEEARRVLGEVYADIARVREQLTVASGAVRSLLGGKEPS